MGIHDRPYTDPPSYGGPTGGRLGRLRLLSVTAWLVIINAGFYLLQTLLSAPGRMDPLTGYGHFSTHHLMGLEVWRLVTFQFLHADIWHLAFNMLGLVVFGPMVEGFLGRKKYLAFYLFCGICGGLAYLILNLVGVMGVQLPGALRVSTTTPLIGASAGVFGIILACARIDPNRTVMLIFPPIPLKLSWLAFGYVFFALVNLLSGGQNAGGDAAHIGGALAGFFFITRAHLLTDFFDVLEDSRKKVAAQPEAHRQRKKAAGEKEVDRILAKVQAEGLHALTERERRTLREASESKRSAS